MKNINLIIIGLFFYLISSPVFAKNTDQKNLGIKKQHLAKKGEVFGKEENSIDDDKSNISRQRHELNYILKKYKYRITRKNRAKLKKAMDDYLKSKAIKEDLDIPRKGFYEWFNKNQKAYNFDKK